MYFLLPTCDQRANSSNQALTQAVCINHPSNPSIPSTPEPDSDTASRQTARPLTDDCVQDILRNIEEHWGSPPILTPDTLAYIFAGQLPPKQAPPSLSLRRRQQASVADDDNVSPLVHRLVRELNRTVNLVDKDLATAFKNDPLINKLEEESSGSNNATLLSRVIKLLETFNDSRADTTSC